jgi:hypothetical protein
MLLPALVCDPAQAQKEAQKKKAQPARPVLAAVPMVNLDQWLFQEEQSALAARHRLETTLKLQIAEVDRVCRLTEVQKKKLQLAGTGDIIHFFDRYEEVRQKFDAIKDAQEKFQQAWQFIQPLQIALQSGLFGAGSLFCKSLHHTLTGDQGARYDAQANESREFRRRALIELEVAALDEEVHLRDEQRQRFLSMLLSHVKLPERSAYEHQVIMFQIAQIPEEKLKLIFDEMQWKLVNWNRSQYQQLGPWLKGSGIWPEKEEQE